MKLGNLNIFIYFLIFLILSTKIAFSADKIESVPLINLEDLSPTFEEDKDELETNETTDDNLNQIKNTSEEKATINNDKIYVNIEALDKITAKTSSIKLAIGEKKFFGHLEIKALKYQLLEHNDSLDMVAYLQVKDLSNKDNNQVFLFNGWTFASSPTLKSIDHPVYDLWITSCDNV